MPNRITIGRIGAPYGLKGWVKVQSFTDPQSNICTYSQGFVQYPTHATWEPYQASTKQLSKTILFKFPDCDDPETARKLTGALLAVERNALPHLAAHEYYWSDLEGLKVVTKSGLVLGVIDHFIPTGANDVMVVKEAEILRLIPYIDDVVIKIDLVRQELIVDWDPDF